MSYILGSAMDLEVTLDRLCNLNFSRIQINTTGLDITDLERG
jgi:hypothetical protein